MAVRVTRRLIPELKVEVAEITDAYGSRHQVTQSILPLAEAADDEEMKFLRDWHEARIEMEADFQQRREDAVRKACEVLGHKMQAGTNQQGIVDPMEGTGYQGCCS